MKKYCSVLLMLALLLGLTACADTEAGFDAKNQIGVTSREDGSGTRGAFIELFGIEQKNEAGEKIDRTTEKAVITDSTSVMMTTVAGDPYAIGYVSLGSLQDSVKALRIDGAAATVENIKSGSYKISRPFNVAVRADLSEAGQDFLHFILSTEGQAVVEQAGYITVGAQGGYTASAAAGKVVVGGSSSVTPVMEKLKEAYQSANPAVTVEIQQTDSSNGMAGAADGTYDIGMASRELKESETAQGLTGLQIALDGIAVVVNLSCPADELTAQQVCDIFTGAVTTWDQILG